jgi:hypothetical protein
MNPNEEPHHTRAADKAFYRAILHEMIHTGISLIRTLEFNTVANVTEGDAPPADAALSYERLTRAVRRTIMLAEKLADPQPGAPNAPAPPPEPSPAGAPPQEILDHDRPDDLAEEAPSNRPIAEQIAALRRDLGLPPIAATALSVAPAAALPAAPMQASAQAAHPVPWPPPPMRPPPKPG